MRKKTSTPGGDMWGKMDVLNKEIVPDDPGFTAEEYGQRYQVNCDVATGRLNRLVSKGKLLKGCRLVRGRRTTTYRFPE